MITCSLRGSSGRERSICISHSLWRSSAVPSCSWDMDHSTLGPYWNSLMLTSESRVFVASSCSQCNGKWGVVPPVLLLRVAVAETLHLGTSFVKTNHLVWSNCSSWEGWQKNSFFYKVFHRWYHPNLILHTLHPQCTQATAISSSSFSLIFGHLA